MKESSNLFMALSDPTRREILRLLKYTDRTPTEMLQRLSVSQPTLSHHLDILKRANLIQGDREGQVHPLFTQHDSVSIRSRLPRAIFEKEMIYERKA